MKLRKIFFTMLASALFICVSPRMAAWADINTHDFYNDGDYEVTGVETLDGNKTMPAGTKLTIKSGAELTFKNNAELIVYDAKLIIESGGTVFLESGKIDAQYDGLIDNSGTFKMAGGTTVRSSTTAATFENKAGGTVTMSSSGDAHFDYVDVWNYGSFTSGNSGSRFAFSGRFLRNYNGMDYVFIDVGSKFSNFGTVESVSVQSRGEVFNSGVIITGTGEIGANLKTMSLSSGQLSPGFTNTNPYYTVTTDAESITVSGMPCSLYTAGATTMLVNHVPVTLVPDASFTSQSMPLSMGDNTIIVELLSGVEPMAFYITVTRVAPAVPHTGSDRQTGLMLSLALLSGAVLLSGAIKSKKRA